MRHFCAVTKKRVGSDDWWEDQGCGKWCCICRECKDWVEHHPMENPRISGAKLSEITMAVSMVLTQYGLDGYQYNECCNILRARLQESFEFNNYNYCPMLGHGVSWIKLREEMSGKGYSPSPIRSGVNMDGA